jgi:hypothetical protein
MSTNPSWFSGTEVCLGATNKKRLPQDCLQVRHVMISLADYIFCKLWSKGILSNVGAVSLTAGIPSLQVCDGYYSHGGTREQHTDSRHYTNTEHHHNSLCPKLRPTASRPVCLRVGLPSAASGQIFVFCLTVVGFLIWGALSDEKMGL